MADEVLVPAVQRILLVVGFVGILSVAVRFIIEQRPYSRLFALLALYLVVFVISALGFFLPEGHVLS